MTGEMSAASSWNPTLLVNTESFNTIDVGDGTTDIELRFGTTELRLFWDTGNSRFEFTQSVYVQGALTASGAVIINDDDVGDATLTFGNDAGDETIIFSDSTNQFEISDDAQIGGNLDVNGNETVSGTLEVNDDNSGNATLTFGNDAGDETLIFNDTSNEFDLSDDLNITGTLDTTGNITTDANLTINEDNGDADAVLTFGNDAGAKALTYSNANTRFEFNDDVHITGTLETTSNVTVGGTITLNGVTYTFPEADGSDNFMLTTNGAGALTWENPATAVMSTFDDRYVNTSGDTMTGALSVQANISGSTLRVDGDAAVWGALSVTGALTTEGNLTINQDNGAADAVLTFGNDAGAETITFSDSTNQFELSDDAKVGGNLEVDGTGTIQSSLEINDDNSGDATLTFGNDAGDETLIFNDTTNEFDLSDDLNVTGTLDATSNISGSGTLSIEGASSLQGAVTFGSTVRINNVTYTFPYSDGTASGKVLKTDGAGHLSWATDTDTNTNAATICDPGQYLNGDGSCVDVIEEGELTNESDLETQLGAINVIVETEINQFSELQAIVADQILLNQTTADNRFVNTSGDTMTGALKVQANISGSTLRVDGDAAVWGALSVTGSLSTEGNLTINQDNGDADAVLTFGNDAGAKTLIYSNTNTRFEFNDDIQTSGNMSGSTLTVDGDVNLHGVTYSFPVTNGDNGQVLTTDGDGNLTWETQTVGVGSGGVLFMAPEYPHAVYFSSGAVSNYIGQMSYDYDETNQENFYRWTSTKGDLQEYWIAVRVRIPDNFSVWDSSEAIQFLYRTTANDAANNFLTMRLYDTAGAEVALTGGNDLYSDNAWTTATVTGPESGGTYTTSEYITIAIKMVANSSGNTDAGYINLNWETSAP
ncbi:MAG: hypothetical protein WC875_05100 [Candidatus Absconditabacterales bacterium]